MEVCSPCNNTLDHIESCNSASSALCMKDLKACLAGLKNGEGLGVLSSTGASRKSGQEGTYYELVDTDENEHESLHSVKRFSKSATFPQPSGLKGKQEDGEVSGVYDMNGIKDFGHPCARSLSFPASLDVVSAMKGSRERQGMPPKKLSVTWAPDVYDPIPTSVSHVPSSKQQRYRNDGKKSGKNKQRGGTKYSRNGKGKDKKWKNSDRSYFAKPFHGESSGVISGKEITLNTQFCPAEMVF